MPLVLSVGTYGFHIYFKDHGHPHVHVISGGKQAKFLIKGQVLIGRTKFKQTQIAEIKNHIQANEARLASLWRQIQSR